LQCGDVEPGVFTVEATEGVQRLMEVFRLDVGGDFDGDGLQVVDIEDLNVGRGPLYSQPNVYRPFPNLDEVFILQRSGPAASRAARPVPRVHRRVH
jgi:hypothetical protein